MDEIYLDEDNLEEVLDWALRAAVYVTLMHFHPNGENISEEIERLEQYTQNINTLHDLIPASIIQSVYQISQEILEDAQKTEQIVSEFVEQMKDL